MCKALVGAPPYFTAPTAGLYNTVLLTGLQALEKNSALGERHRHPLSLTSVSSDRDDDILFAFM